MNNKNKVETKVLYKDMGTYINKDSIQLFLNTNKHLFQMELFSLNIIGTWNCMLYGRNKEILVSITYYEDTILNIKSFNDIFKKIILKSNTPKYEEYISFSKTRNKNNIMDVVLNHIHKENIELVNKDEYYNEIKYLKNKLIEGFKPDYNRKVFKENIHAADCLETINKGNLSFMGIYIINKDKYNDGKEFIVFKILEKYIGDNDTDSIYFKFREKGKIYTGISSYITSKGLFLTGIIGNYSEELWNSILKELLHMEINEEKLFLAKEKLINEIKYLIFEYGTAYILEPYSRYIGKNITKEDICDYIDKINIDIINDFFNKIIIKKIKVAV
ncbi:hypothetical protein [Clostridium sp. Marseille-Q2269]|uniref:hypothetical protein n=1 Tax=Clostridium sp. Marseille-Q2269 TaxID=2942205 RepID=UPI00207379CB|nr:hypothetical protein [Clostridium sp. Marseille-Q2269]